MVYTASFKDVGEEGLLEIMSVRKTVSKSKSMLSAVNLISTFNVIINSIFIIGISL